MNDAVTITPRSAARRSRWCSTRRTRRAVSGRFRPRAAARRSCARPRTRTSRSCGAARAAHGATLIEARFPRAYIDPNRSLVDIDADAARGRLARTRSRRRARPSTASASSGGSRAAASRCTRASCACDEVRARIDRYWQPVPRGARRGARRASPQLRRASGTSTAIRCRRWATRSPRIPGRARADFVLGDRDGTTCEPAFTRAGRADAARAWATACAINDPYKGVELVRTHAGRRKPPQPADRDRSARSTWTRTRSCRTRATRGSKRDLGGDRVARLARLTSRERTRCICVWPTT